jgi:orotidine-5'-phosphate decarboxylase
MKRTLSLAELDVQIRKKRSFLCIGLDTDMDKLPTHFTKNSLAFLNFNRQIIEATHDLCVAYKINTAFYEALGTKGWDLLKQTIDLIPLNLFIIADAKRADIGNTSSMYAKAFFEEMDVHAITLSPYMGKDSISPFLEYKHKWSILLGLTSNEGAKDFQLAAMKEGKPLYEHVLETSSKWGTKENMMYVIGATKEESFKRVREILPEHFLLVPGVGSQGGDLEAVIKQGATKDGRLLINASRSIIYASNAKDFAAKARAEAMRMKLVMEESIKN